MPSPNVLHRLPSANWQPDGGVLRVVGATGYDMSRAKHSLDLSLQAQRHRALAPAYDPVRRDFELALADRMEQEAADLLVPPEPLQKGLGGEIIPAVDDGLPGPESALKEPDLVNAEASRQRANLLERAGALELGIETAEQANANDPIQRMICHQMGAVHRRALVLLAESERANDAQVACLKAKTAARLLDGFARAALVLQRLQSGTNQSVQVQNISVAGPAIVGQMAGR